MATVPPLAVSAASAAPRTCIAGTPGLAPFLGSRAHLSLRLRGSPRGVACALRRRPTKYKTKIQIQNEDVAAADDMDGEDEDDALEALFKQLEEDLENDDLSVDDDDDEISEEDMARFEQELAEAIGEVGGADETAGDLFSGFGESGTDENVGSEQPELKSWQLRRLARALKIGRRKTSIKNLAGELGLDRALVIELLRNPPPKLLVLSETLPDEAPSNPEVKEVEPSSSAIVDEPETSHATESNPEMDLPIHVRSAEWSARKRLKKVHLETLERVYLRSKHPTNTMISSIVQVTNLPRKTIVKWFEDRRERDGVPDHRAAFKRSLSETVASL